MYISIGMDYLKSIHIRFMHTVYLLSQCYNLRQSVSSNTLVLIGFLTGSGRLLSAAYGRQYPRYRTWLPR